MFDARGSTHVRVSWRLRPGCGADRTVAPKSAATLSMSAAAPSMPAVASSKPAAGPSSATIPAEYVDPDYVHRVKKLQRRHGRPDWVPPPEAVRWSKKLLKRWYEDGGVLTLQAAELMDDSEKSSFIEQIGGGLPTRMLEPTVTPAGGLLGAAARGEKATFDELGVQLAKQGYALAELGAPDAVWPALCAEGAALWAQMKPGIVTSQDGVTTEGRAPSGAERGDRFLACSTAEGRHAVLESVDRALSVVGTCLNESLGRVLVLRSDPFFACFPGGGARYGAHFDGGGEQTGCKVTTTLYANPRWREADGGLLHLLDERARCWRTVLPTAGRLLLFRADLVLHKVEPVAATRYALTAWWYVSQHGERSPEGEMRCCLSKYAPGDPRRVEVRSLAEGSEGRASAASAALGELRAAAAR